MTKMQRYFHCAAKMCLLEADTNHLNVFTDIGIRQNILFSIKEFFIANNNARKGARFSEIYI